MLKMKSGSVVPDSHLLNEEFEITENGFMANIGADKLIDLFKEFILMQEQELFFFLEIPSDETVELQLRKSDSDPFHKDIYYIDGLSQIEAFTIMLRYGELLTNDGVVRFGYGLSDNSAEIMLHKYNVVTLWTEEFEKYLSLFNKFEIPETDDIITAWDIFTAENPGESNVIEINGKKFMICRKN